MTLVSFLDFEILIYLDSHILTLIIDITGRDFGVLQREKLLQDLIQTFNLSATTPGTTTMGPAPLWIREETRFPRTPFSAAAAPSTPVAASPVAAAAASPAAAAGAAGLAASLSTSRGAPEVTTVDFVMLKVGVAGGVSKMEAIYRSTELKNVRFDLRSYCISELVIGQRDFFSDASPVIMNANFNKVTIHRLSVPNMAGLLKSEGCLVARGAH